MKLKLFILSLAVVLCTFSACTVKESTDRNVTNNNVDSQQVSEVENIIEPVQSDENNEKVDNTDSVDNLDNVESVDRQVQQIQEFVLQQEENDYKLVQPDRGELQMIPCDLEYILSMFHEDYDCTKDNIYDYLFHCNHLDYVYPNYLDTVVFESEPLQESKWGSSRWYLLDVPQKDPLGKFPEIPEEVYDENGNIDTDLAWNYYETAGTPWLEMCIGYNKFSGEYIDWLVEDVWNGKADYDTFFKFEDGTALYYYDGYYYTPALLGDRGGGIFYGPHIENLVPLENSLFKLEYHLSDNIDRCDSHNTAIIGLKEKDDGSRFWSIFSIDYNYVGNKFDY